MRQGIELQLRGLEAFLATLAESSDGGRLHRADGVTALVSPVTPTHSVTNSVVARGPEALRRELPALAALYDGAGIRAWTVWVPEPEREMAVMLESAGHLLDAAPAAMVLELAELPDPPAGELDWDSAADPQEVGRINDLAYGFDHPAFELVLAHPPADDALRFYRARVESETACVLSTLDVAGDCVIFLVATLKHRRGRRLAGLLLHRALAEARERGLATSSLQATKLGRPAYERLGYRTITSLEMWERRRPE